MKIGFIFAFFAVWMISAAVNRGGWRLLMLWPAVSFAILAMGYIALGPVIYRKSNRGLLSPISQALLLPYLLLIWCIWHVLRLIKREPAYHQLTDRVFIGRRLLSNEMPDNFEHVIDLTCEFNEPLAVRSTSYHLFPILDGFAPAPEQLSDWARQVAGLSGNVYIHCAQGHGRTCLFAAALLLQTGHSKTPRDAIGFVALKRPLVRLNRRQWDVLCAIDGSA